MMKRKYKMKIKNRESKHRSGNKLEYFFYATNCYDAEDLMRELVLLNYSVEISDVSNSEVSFLINGYTSDFISDENRPTWFNRMKRLAMKHNCIFDGWGSELNI